MLIVDGLKLIMNTAYGLINSNYKLPISCKVLGRFICLKGQALLLNLAYKIISFDANIKLINVNTDGLIIKLPDEKNHDYIQHIIDDDRNGYFTLGSDKIDLLVQSDVNSYIKICYF